MLYPPAVWDSGTDGEFHETDRVHPVLEKTSVPSFAAETAKLHAESASIGAGVSGGHSAWRSRVGGLRLRRPAHSRSGNVVVESLSSSHHSPC